MNTLAVVLEAPEQLALSRLDLTPPGDEDVVVDVEWSGISTGTERLLWSGRMPPFPGMGYPLVPGYESVGRVVARRAALRRARSASASSCPAPAASATVRGLFGGAASRARRARPRASCRSTSALGERRRAAGAGRHRPARHRAGCARCPT